jgi:hypothetical protein
MSWKRVGEFLVVSVFVFCFLAWFAGVVTEVSDAAVVTEAKGKAGLGLGLGSGFAVDEEDDRRYFGELYVELSKFAESSGKFVDAIVLETGEDRSQFLDEMENQVEVIGEIEPSLGSVKFSKDLEITLVEYVSLMKEFDRRVDDGEVDPGFQSEMVSCSVRIAEVFEVVKDAVLVDGV